MISKPCPTLRRIAPIVDEASTIEGYMSRRDMEFLAMLAACPTASGEVLEIGSYRGRSTVLLAKSIRAAGGKGIVAVDPLRIKGRLPEEPDREVDGRTVLDANLRRAGVLNEVEFHRSTSHELAQQWRRPLRMLWIDGDHSTRGKKLDFDDWSPHLVDGGVIAIHDVLNPLEGCIRVFIEDVLASDNFGPAGVVGSIGWAEYHANIDEGRRWRFHKQRLMRRLTPLIPYHDLNLQFHGLTKIRYRLLRSRVPHRGLREQQWLRMVA